MTPGFSPASARRVPALHRATSIPTTLPADPPQSTTADLQRAARGRRPRRRPSTASASSSRRSGSRPDGVYWIHDTLAVQPALGYPLRPKTQYAIVVTNAVKAADGSTITPSGDLAEVLGLAPVEARVQAAHDLYAPAVAELASSGVAASSIVHLAVFTTNDPTAELFAVVDDVHANVPAPTVGPDARGRRTDQTADYDVYEGTYGPSPNYQAGHAAVQRHRRQLRLRERQAAVCRTPSRRTSASSCPTRRRARCPPAGTPSCSTRTAPAATTGRSSTRGTPSATSWRSTAWPRSASTRSSPATVRALPGVSDPNYEGDEDLLFFNVNNPLAARTNGQQGAVDFVQLARLFTETKVTVPASVSRTAGADRVRRDEGRLHRALGGGPRRAALPRGRRAGARRGAQRIGRDDHRRAAREDRRRRRAWRRP